MDIQQTIDRIIATHVKPEHRESDYFAAIRELVAGRNRAQDAEERARWQAAVDRVYGFLRDEILTSMDRPRNPVTFGTSGWRGILGKDLTIRSVAFVTAAILGLYREAETSVALREALGVTDFAEMQERGCVVGFDNRFGGKLLALAAINVLAAENVRILYAGEATTGILSASVLERRAAFSINLTPSHNPMEYGGFKYNGADAGPAAPILTNRITEQARRIIEAGESEFIPADLDLQRPLDRIPGVVREDALASWQNLVRKNRDRHGLDYDAILRTFARNRDVAVVIDPVHGAARSYIRPLLGNSGASLTEEDDRLAVLRDNADVTFGGIAPEPSSENMQPTMKALGQRPEPFKVGAVIDPDGDRIRFTDGEVEISMNQFGAMAYHFLHEIKGKQGMVAKTVATSNLANALAKSFGEDVFEPRVGFKEFKPVIGQALVFFEESDGISIIGHTPEKDAFIGLLLALDMVQTRKQSLGAYLREIETRFGSYFPARDGVKVSLQGDELTRALDQLKKYGVGATIRVGGKEKKIREVITIDGRKMIFEDNSWIMIRPSGTEPKVRFYVEARNREETPLLVEAAKSMLAEIGLLS
ncbi:phosphoglucomutase [Desulfolithobacter sp.]